MNSPDLAGRLHARLARVREHLGRVFAGRENGVLYSSEHRTGYGWSLLEPVGWGNRYRAYQIAVTSWHRRGEGVRWQIGNARWEDHKPAAGVTFEDFATVPHAEEMAEIREQANGDEGKIAREMERVLRARNAIAADALPYYLTVAEGLALVDAHADTLVADVAAEILAFLEACPVPNKKAVMARDELVNRWPWPRHGHRPGAVLCALAAMSPSLPPEELLPGAWPGEVAPLDVARWIEPVVRKHNPDDPEHAETIREMAQAGHPQFMHETRWVSCAAVLYAALQDVERGQKRPAIAIDAGQYHHDFLMAWRDLPKNAKELEYPHSAGKIELYAPGQSVQLLLDLGAYTISEAMITALRQHRKWEGLRHWAAIQRLLSVEGGRAGWVRWTLDDHLNALGISPKERTRSAVRENAARQVEAFTKLELAAYDKHGTLRERRPLLIVGAKYDRLHGSEWELDGMELQINPLLYSGVREDGGKLGSNWHPAPIELARVDHVRYPHALSMGLILTIRWRLAMNEGKDHITLSGEKALRLAGITYRKHDPRKAWTALERNLEELQRIGGLGRWEWNAADTPWSLKGRLDLWQAPWMLDRTLHEVRPLELPPGPSVLTGSELKVWRKGHGLTQAQAAERLGVHRITITRAEKAGAESLPPALADKLRQARLPAGRM